MNLYRLENNEAQSSGYYAGVLVAAETPDDAVTIHPASDAWFKVTVTETGEWGFWWDEDADDVHVDEIEGAWPGGPSNVEAELLGTAKDGTERGVVMAHFICTDG